MIKRLALFTLLNFGALAIGGLFTGEGVPSEWYQNLDKAPWTPPGWVFGAAWTLIMICLSVFMAKSLEVGKNKTELLGLYIFQLVLNIIWNPIFFKFHAVNAGLVTISSLTVVLGIMLYKFGKANGKWSLLLLPYFVWLLIATSLNAYVCFMN